ncbi:MAG: oligosaccharide flippase family protein [Bacteroidota bacterium]|nr:oligosaccharide flippase family protein [Bacteroidota bacterium]MDP4215496.1 oligosaccharide flippase family protein [Bacteroidota bacterium]MDP4247393.1 oligosaccharide flippase family protein [Bacteroidota bacterium]MDP4252547.1 oligosaccharide flippase family protein [Bacteroidota bacterium]MDP4257817.1 oligosaccharide flippase family protein [Bacteroidota bacterium]
MRKRIIHDISASSLQVIISQLAGLILFFVTSSYLSKSVFGQLNWALAVLLVSFAVLGFGIDQITVRKIAAGEDASSYLRIYLFHVLLTGILFLALLSSVSLISGNGYARWNLLLFLAIGQFFTFLSLPFKQIANGKEDFRALLFMSAGANLIKVTGIFLLALLHAITLDSFVLLYVLAAAAELLISIFAARHFLNLRAGITWDRRRYSRLIRESLPQLGVILCSAGIARFDWIFLGIISTAPVVAEYSFAYRAFEVSSLPLLVLAPLLLPRITRWFAGSDNTPLRGRRKAGLFLLARFEMILAWGCALVLNMIWAPLVDWLTGNRYGAVNSAIFLLLSCSLPFLYINNLLWCIHFALGRMKFIFFVFMITLLITSAGDLILIPFFQGKGAAIAYLSAIVVQTIQFIHHRGKDRMVTGMARLWQPLLLCGASALISGWLAIHLHEGTVLRLLAAMGAYLVLLFASGQLRVHDWVTCKRMIYA